MKQESPSHDVAMEDQKRRHPTAHLKAIRAIKAQDQIDHGGSDHPWTRETSGWNFFLKGSFGSLQS